jgi:hypothetical protein
MVSPTKTIYMDEKVGQFGKFEWKKTCIDVGLSHQKLKTLMKTKFVSKVILFQEPWKIKMPLICVMGSKRWWSCKVTYRMHTLGNLQSIAKTMILIVEQCIINKTQGYWLLFNALFVVFSLNVVM